MRLSVDCHISGLPFELANRVATARPLFSNVLPGELDFTPTGASSMLGGPRFHPFYPHSDLRARPCNGFRAERIGITDFEDLECSGRYGHFLIRFYLPCGIERNSLLCRVHRYPVALGPRLADL